MLRRPGALRLPAAGVLLLGLVAPGAALVVRPAPAGLPGRIGVGRLLAGAEDQARSAGATEMLLHAQRRAEAFYAASGYVAESETFMDAGIEHVAMRKAL